MTWLCTDSDKKQRTFDSSARFLDDFNDDIDFNSITSWWYYVASMTSRGYRDSVMAFIDKELKKWWSKMIF